MRQKTFRFREFPVYKDTLIFINNVKNYTKTSFPKREQFGLTSQLWRAMDSQKKHEEFIQNADKLYRQLKAFSSHVRKNKKSS